MHRTWPALAAAILVAVLSVNFFLQPAPAQSADEAQQLALSDRMALIKADWRDLRKLITRPDRNDESLELVVYIQRQALEAKQLVPSLAGELPKAERDAFVVGYRQEMIHLLQSLLQLEEALLEADNQRAFKIASAIQSQQLEAHGHYRKKDE